MRRNWSRVVVVVVCLFTSFQGKHTYTKYTFQFKGGTNIEQNTRIALLTS